MLVSWKERPIPARVRRVAARAYFGQPQLQPRQRRARRLELLAAHALEVHGVQRFARRSGEARIEGDALARVRARMAVVLQERLGEAPVGRHHGDARGAALGQANEQFRLGDGRQRTRHAPDDSA